ncbi:retrovirus-related pol polyprotein from transposon TNT 1-94 [Tanacetum coccineum]
MDSMIPIRQKNTLAEYTILSGADNRPTMLDKDLVAKDLWEIVQLLMQGQQRVVKCFNCKGEGHMARQCPKPKRKRDATWFREKVLLVEAHRKGKVLKRKALDSCCSGYKFFYTLAKFIDDGRREHKEMEIFIKEFRTTNELLLKIRSSLLSELKIKITSKATRSKEINEIGINENEPPRFKQDVQEKPHDDGEKNKSSSIH